MNARFSDRLHAGRHPHLGRIQDPHYWRDLHPKGLLSVEGQAAVLSSVPPPGDAQGSWARHGYAVVPALWDPSTTGAVLEAVLAVVAQGWPGIFSLVFDAVWDALLRSPLPGLAGHHLGAPARFVPHVWVHHVPAVDGARGWPPHVDYPDVKGPPHTLTAWVALTPATVENGCMHVVPHGVLPQLVARVGGGAPPSWDDTLTLLHHVRALPADPGTALLWRPGVLHWGGVSAGQTPQARWALSTEWRRADHSASPESWVPGGRPGFAERLEVVKRGLAVFADPEREPHAARFREAW